MSYAPADEWLSIWLWEHGVSAPNSRGSPHGVTGVQGREDGHGLEETGRLHEEAAVVVTEFLGTGRSPMGRDERRWLMWGEGHPGHTSWTVCKTGR